MDKKKGNGWTLEQIKAVLFSLGVASDEYMRARELAHAEQEKQE